MATLNQGLGVRAGGSGGGGGSDTNLGNSNLTADAAARTYQTASGGTVTFQTNAAADTLKIGDNGKVQVGVSAANYTLPPSRSSAQYKAVEDASGGCSFQQQKAQQQVSFSIDVASAADRTKHLFKIDGSVLSAPSLSTITVANMKRALLYTPTGLTNPTITGVTVFYAMTETTGPAGVPQLSLWTQTSGVGAATFGGTDSAIINMTYPTTTNFIQAVTSSSLSISLTNATAYGFLLNSNTGQTLTNIFMWGTVQITHDVVY